MRRRLRSNNTNILKLVMVGIVAMAGGFLLTSFLGSKSETQALSATEFQAGRIIDDSIFYNPNTMTAAEIDAFIDSHTPACDMWGTQMIYGMTRAEYVKQLRAQGQSKYHDPPFVCVSEYYENPTTHKTNFSTGGRKEEGMLSAGEIIYQAAHEYNINPQVLLVMLKKESYVWGDDWPHDFQYNTVMGYACPDGAPCDSKYFGFYNQVMMAAWQLNYYREHIYSYNYRPYVTNQILYNPDRSCGSKSVYLENIATTSLYIYTPYTPNDGALQNYPGTSWCGSYGNRNFYMYFREWFGSTLNGPNESIDSYYQESELGERLGEAKGPLGNNSSTGIYFQEYENGFIVGSDRTGYWESMGPIREVWKNQGFESGFLGFPVGKISTNESTGIYFQQYEHGYVVGSDKTGYWISDGKIREYWASTGFEGGPLGFPISETGNNSSTGIYFQEYENGFIVGSDRTGYWESSGPIREVWKNQGFESGFLGFPVGKIYTNESTGIYFQQYEHGYIVGTDKTGYWISDGKIREYWASTGFEGGPLGFPISETGNNSSTGIYFQEYENGFIVGSDRTGYWESSGPIREVWKNQGFESGFLGFPVGKIYTNESTGIYFQQYEHGYIVGTDKTGYWISDGKIREYWASTGFESGPLGFPVGKAKYNSHTSTYSQAYEHGTVYCNNSNCYRR